MSEYPRVHDIYGWQPRSTPLPTKNLDVEVSFKPTEVWIYDMHVHCIYVDNRHVLLYQNPMGITYRALCKAGYDYPPLQTILPMCMKSWGPLASNSMMIGEMHTLLLT